MKRNVFAETRKTNPTCSELACGEQGRTVEVSNLFKRAGPSTRPSALLRTGPSTRSFDVAQDKSACSGQAGGGAKLPDVIRSLPGKVGKVSSKVAAERCFGVNRPGQFQMLNHTPRRQRKELSYDFT